MTQYTIDLFGWNFNYSSSDVADVVTKIFIIMLFTILYSIFITIFWYIIQAFMHSCIHVFMYFAKKLYY